MAALITLTTSGPPFSSRLRSDSRAFSLSFFEPMCFLIGVTRFLMCALRCEPTLPDSSRRIYSAFRQISSLAELRAVLSGQTSLVSSSISFYAEDYMKLEVLHLRSYSCRHCMR
jgi:hypothetical protein